MKNGLFHRLTAPYLIGMSQYFYIPLISIVAASNGTSLFSIGCGDMIAPSYPCAPKPQNMTSQTYSSKSNKKEESLRDVGMACQKVHKQGRI